MIFQEGSLVVHLDALECSQVIAKVVASLEWIGSCRNSHPAVFYKMSQLSISIACPFLLSAYSTFQGFNLFQNFLVWTTSCSTLLFGFFYWYYSYFRDSRCWNPPPLAENVPSFQYSWNVSIAEPLGFPTLFVPLWITLSLALSFCTSVFYNTCSKNLSWYSKTFWNCAFRCFSIHSFIHLIFSHFLLFL